MLEFDCYVIHKGKHYTCHIEIDGNCSEQRLQIQQVIYRQIISQPINRTNILFLQLGEEAFEKAVIEQRVSYHLEPINYFYQVFVDEENPWGKATENNSHALCVTANHLLHRRFEQTFILTKLQQVSDIIRFKPMQQSLNTIDKIEAKKIRFRRIAIRKRKRLPPDAYPELTLTPDVTENLLAPARSVSSTLQLVRANLYMGGVIILFLGFIYLFRQSAVIFSNILFLFRQFSEALPNIPPVCRAAEFPKTPPTATATPKINMPPEVRMHLETQLSRLIPENDFKQFQGFSDEKLLEAGALEFEKRGLGVQAYTLLRRLYESKVENEEILGGIVRNGLQAANHDKLIRVSGEKLLKISPQNQRNIRARDQYLYYLFENDVKRKEHYPADLNSTTVTTTVKKLFEHAKDLYLHNHRSETVLVILFFLSDGQHRINKAFDFTPFIDMEPETRSGKYAQADYLNSYAKIHLNKEALLKAKNNLEFLKKNHSSLPSINALLSEFKTLTEAQSIALSPTARRIINLKQTGRLELREVELPVGTVIVTQRITPGIVSQAETYTLLLVMEILGEKKLVQLDGTIENDRLLTRIKRDSDSKPFIQSLPQEPAHVKPEDTMEFRAIIKSSGELHTINYGQSIILSTTENSNALNDLMPMAEEEIKKCFKVIKHHAEKLSDDIPLRDDQLMTMQNELTHFFNKGIQNVYLLTSLTWVAHKRRDSQALVFYGSLLLYFESTFVEHYFVKVLYFDHLATIDPTAAKYYQENAEKSLHQAIVLNINSKDIDRMRFQTLLGKRVSNKDFYNFAKHTPAETSDGYLTWIVGGAILAVIGLATWFYMRPTRKAVNRPTLTEQKPLQPFSEEIFLSLGDNLKIALDSENTLEKHLATIGQALKNFAAFNSTNYLISPAHEAIIQKKQGDLSLLNRQLTTIRDRASIQIAAAASLDKNIHHYQEGLESKDYWVTKKDYEAILQPLCETFELDKDIRSTESKRIIALHKDAKKKYQNLSQHLQNCKDTTELKKQTTTILEQIQKALDPITQITQKFSVNQIKTYQQTLTRVEQLIKQLEENSHDFFLAENNFYDQLNNLQEATERLATVNRSAPPQPPVIPAHPISTAPQLPPITGSKSKASNKTAFTEKEEARELKKVRKEQSTESSTEKKRQDQPGELQEDSDKAEKITLSAPPQLSFFPALQAPREVRESKWIPVERKSQTEKNELERKQQQTGADNPRQQKKDKDTDQFLHNNPHMSVLRDKLALISNCLNHKYLLLDEEGKLNVRLEDIIQQLWPDKPDLRNLLENKCIRYCMMRDAHAFRILIPKISRIAKSLGEQHVAFNTLKAEDWEKFRDLMMHGPVYYLGITDDTTAFYDKPINTDLLVREFYNLANTTLRNCDKNLFAEPQEFEHPYLTQFLKLPINVYRFLTAKQILTSLSDLALCLRNFGDLAQALGARKGTLMYKHCGVLHSAMKCIIMEIRQLQRDLPMSNTENDEDDLFLMTAIEALKPIVSFIECGNMIGHQFEYEEKDADAGKDTCYQEISPQDLIILASTEADDLYKTCQKLLSRYRPEISHAITFGVITSQQ